MLRSLYKKYICAPALDRVIRLALDAGTNLYARCAEFYFPRNYIRHWKYDMLRGRYEKETVALFKEILKPGMTVIDIGAHIGYFTRLFSRKVGRDGRVYAFEADPENYALLEKNTQGLCNVVSQRLAIADKKGTIDFYHCDDKSGAHSTLANVPLPFAKRKLIVTAVELDSWVRERGIQKMDIIKMDIEGGESAALNGMREALRMARGMVIEFAPAWIEAAGSSPLSFLEDIESRGFSIYAVTKEGLVPVSPARDETWRAVLPKSKNGSPARISDWEIRSGSHHGEFINLYCVKVPSETNCIQMNGA